MVSENGGHPNTRRSPRVAPPEEFVVLVESFGQFLEQHAKNISEGGMFLRSAAPPPPGTRLRFAIRLADGYPLIQGEGEVVWRREQREGPFEPPGMGIRFLRLEEQGRELVSKLVEERRRLMESRGEAVRSPEGQHGAVAPEHRARQALRELREAMAEAPEADREPREAPEMEPFGPLEAPGDEPEPEAAGADLFAVEEGPAAEAQHNEIGWQGEGGGVPEKPSVPKEGRGLQGEDELPTGAAESASAEEETLPPVELPEIGRPAGYYDQEEPLPPARARWFWPIAVPLGLLALAALAYGARQLGYLAWAGLPAPGTVRVARTVPVEAPTARPVTPTPIPTVEATPVAQSVPAELPTPSPTPAVSPSPVQRRPSPTARPVPPAASSAAMVRRLTWKTVAGGVEVHLLFDGAVPRSRVRLIRLEDPPRALLRIKGIRRQYQPAEIPVNSGPLRGIRVWLHDEFHPPQLYVVLDLDAADARVSRRVQGSEVVLTVR